MKLTSDRKNSDYSLTNVLNTQKNYETPITIEEFKN